MTVVRNTTEGRAWVRIQTEDGNTTSASGSYVTIDQTFNFEPGEDTKTITITVDSSVLDTATDYYFYLRMTQFSVGSGKVWNDDTVDGRIYFRVTP